MKLSAHQTDLLKYLKVSRYQMRIRPGKPRIAYIYDRKLMCWDDWSIRITTVDAMIDKGALTLVGTDNLTGDLCYEPSA